MLVGVAAAVTSAPIVDGRATVPLLLPNSTLRVDADGVGRTRLESVDRTRLEGVGRTRLESVVGVGVGSELDHEEAAAVSVCASQMDSEGAV